MSIKFTEKGSWLVYAMLRNPNMLGVIPKDPLPPYKAPDDAASLQLLSLNRLLDKKLTKKDGDNVSFQEASVKLKKSLVQRLKEMLKHYESMTRLSPNIQAHMELSYTLDGKDLEDDIEDWEEKESDDKGKDGKKSAKNSAKKPEPAEEPESGEAL